MAADESSLDKFNDDILVTDIVRIQAFIRGQVVRKQMKEIQKLYEEIVHDIDGPDMEVIWSHDFLSRPIVRKVKKVESKVINQNRIKDNSNQSCTSTGSQFYSVVTEKTLVSMATFGHVNTNTNALERPLKRPNVMSAEVQTETFPDSEVQYVRVTDIDHKCQHRHDQKDQHSADMSAKEQQIKSRKTFDSEVQGEGIDFSSRFVHNSLPLVENNTHILDSVNVSQVGSHFSSGQTGTSFQGLMSGEIISEQPEKLGHVNCDTRISEIIEPEKLPHESGPKERSLENAESKNLPYEISQNGKSAEKSEQDFSLEMDRAKHKLVKDKKDTRRATEWMPGCAETVDIPNDKNQLLELKNTVAMELLWVQQAINSRKHYLKLREQLK